MTAEDLRLAKWVVDGELAFAELFLSLQQSDDTKVQYDTLSQAVIRSNSAWPGPSAMHARAAG
ncbi:hypothetical protein QZH47_05485 [Pseudomonas corrugata]